MIEQRHFVNLTNGIEAIRQFGLTDYRFIRLQSTHCEQKRWSDIIMGLSDDFLMCAALGHRCTVYDYGANKPIPRAIWQGLEWIKFCIYRRWDDAIYMPRHRALSSAGFFEEKLRELRKPAKSKLDYFRRYRNGAICIEAVTSSTGNDGDYDLYAKIAKGGNHDI